MAVCAVSVIVAVVILVIAPVSFGHRLRTPQAQSEMTMRSRVGVTVGPLTVAVGVQVGMCGAHRFKLARRLPERPDREGVG